MIRLPRSVRRPIECGKAKTNAIPPTAFTVLPLRRMLLADPVFERLGAEGRVAAMFQKLLGAALCLLAFGVVSKANASTILFQSTPDLTIPQYHDQCSICAPANPAPFIDHRLFDTFTLNTNSQIENVLFNIYTGAYPLVDVNISIWSIIPGSGYELGPGGNPGPNSLGLPGSILLSETFSPSVYSPQSLQMETTVKQFL